MKSYLITGANRGIGLEFVKQLFKRGERVFACCRLPDEADDLQKLSGDSVTIISLKLDNSESIQQLPQFLKEEPLDVLFNVAGEWGGDQQTLMNTEESKWLHTFQVNAMAPFFIARTLLPNLKKGKSKIIANMTSNMGSISDNTSGGRYIYRSSKAALNAVTKSLAIDLQPEHFKVVAIHPGWVKTRMGGPGATLSVEESVKGMIEVLDTLKESENGAFLDYSHQIRQW